MDYLVLKLYFPRHLHRCSKPVLFSFYWLCCDWHVYCGRGLSLLSALLSSQPQHIDFVEFSSHTLPAQMAKPRKKSVYFGHLFLSIGRCHQYFNGDLCVKSAESQLILPLGANDLSKTLLSESRVQNKLPRGGQRVSNGK